MANQSNQEQAKQAASGSTTLSADDISSGSTVQQTSGMAAGSHGSRRKVLLMVPMLHQGGFERVCVTTARVLRDLYDVTIVIFSDKDINYDITGLNVVNIDVPAVKSKTGKILNVLKRIRKVRELKRTERYDISYSFGSSANLINVLSRCHERVLTGLRCQTDMENAREVRTFTVRSDQVLSCSREIMRQLERDWNYTKSSYIYNPLDVADIRARAAEPVEDYPFPELDHDVRPYLAYLDRKSRMLTADGLDAEHAQTTVQAQLDTPYADTIENPTIASMGRDDYIKGNWHLVKAFSIVHQHIPGARLMIYGAGSYAGCRQLATDLGLSDCVAFPGNRKNPFPYVARADLYVLPSNHEGFPNALLEAMALGKPVVAADCKTGPREIILSDEEYETLVAAQPDGSTIHDVMDGTYGTLVPDMDQTENYDASVITEDDQRLAAAILRTLQSPERMRHDHEQSLLRAQTYTPERYRDSLDQIFQTILEDSTQ